MGRSSRLRAIWTDNGIGKWGKKYYKGGRFAKYRFIDWNPDGFFTLGKPGKMVSNVELAQRKLGWSYWEFFILVLLLCFARQPVALSTPTYVIWFSPYFFSPSLTVAVSLSLHHSLPLLKFNWSWEWKKRNATNKFPHWIFFHFCSVLIL